jgi:hypothetical protein
MVTINGHNFHIFLKQYTNLFYTIKLQVLNDLDNRSPNHGPPPRVEPIAMGRKKEGQAQAQSPLAGSSGGKRNGENGGSSSSFSETISHFASSLISGRLKHPISGGGDGPSGIKRRPFDYDRSSSSGNSIVKCSRTGVDFTNLAKSTVLGGKFAVQFYQHSEPLKFAQNEW